VKNVDPSEDNMLKITSDGRKVSYTQRMIDPTLPYEPESKIFKASENIFKEYQDSTDIKGTQIVFLDMATPKGTDKSKTETNADNTTDDGYDEESARLYDDMRDYLVKKGIPKREIAFIHEADSDAKRKQLFEDVNNGKVRVLIGSTGKMGVGMNAQKRVVAIHHLDAPWRPGDVEQRDGRAFRQKNINDEVSKYVYVTKGSFDSRLWDILDRKQHFINQIMNGEDVGRTAEDTGEVTLSAAEVKALASGNPLIEEQTKLTDEIKKLENLQKAYNSSIRFYAYEECSVAS
jgi:superfamily II DNA/RNA helicase